MGLLERSGREYVVPRRLDQKELVKLVMPLLDAQPAPEVVYRRLAQPVFGLVPDQIHILLAFLLVQGELDVMTGAQSMRDLYETLPTPIQYDRIVPGRALGLEALRDRAATPLDRRAELGLVAELLADPRYAVAVMNVAAVALGPERTRLYTETRVRALGPAARRRFRLYWLLIRPFSGLLRRSMLRGIAARATARPRG
jgi:hypothetical protein